MAADAIGGWAMMRTIATVSPRFKGTIHYGKPWYARHHWAYELAFWLILWALILAVGVAR